ncbi:MAG: PDZ domain-containing protein [Candidatus Aminicenantaceae bacterium]
MKRALIFLGMLLYLFTVMSVSIPEQEKIPDALMLRFPDVSAEKIVFVYAGDLWTVLKEGGLARKLSSPKGLEIFPKFSPDGKMIAFSGNYDGNTDVYVMPAVGGYPERITHHPASDLVVEWYPDGKNILYRSGMKSPSYRFNRFFKQPVKGGMPETLPLPYGELASFSPDGNRMAFQYISREFRTWKRYRGGMASDLWIYDLVRNISEKITDFEGTDALPMWHENTIYFLSDRDKLKKYNIWAYDLNTKETRQVTKFDKYDVKWPSIGPDSIIFENGGKLYLLDLKSEASSPVSIKVPADLPKIRAQLKDCSENIESFSLSPTGKRALFGARGEVFTVPEKHGSVRNLTNTSGIAERYPAWSPDGKYVAYFSDVTGEYELYLRQSDGKEKERQITTGGTAYRFGPVWSPDSKKIAFIDKTSSLFVLNVDEGKPKYVDKDKVTYIRDYTWSSDSRWLAYTNHIENSQGVIMIYDTSQDKKHQVTSGYYNDFRPVFDPEGKYLFFYSNRTFRPVYSDLDSTWVYPNATNIYVVTLRKDIESPIAPRSDEEKVEEEKKEEKGAEEKAEEKKEEKKEPAKKTEKKGDEEDKPKPVKIDFEGIEERVEKLPVNVGNVGPLNAVKGKVVYVRYPATGAAKPGVPSGTLAFYDLKDREEKVVISGIDTYDLSADGKKVLYKSKTTWGIIDLAPKKKVGDGKIATNMMKAWINPREEWKQLFNEAWRIERDFFYAPNMHGIDWKAIKKRYAAMLAHVVDREDLNYVIGEMIAELNSSHSYVGGGDIERGKRISVGLLGCDFKLDREKNTFRITKIYQGAPWDAEARSPLRRPGIKVNEGEYLLAVNGQPLDTSKDVWASFQGLAGEVVILTVNSTSSMTGSRDVIVKPLSSDYRLRNLAWIESNRKKVAKLTNGRVGYIYVPDTSITGQNELIRQFIPQHRLDGLIIDERFNSGGQFSDRFIEMMNRPLYAYAARREHRDLTIPYLSHIGPKVMIINEWAGSGGDAFPYCFRKAGLGPIVGKRTWGGLIGISGNPMLIDGGFITAPNLAIWHPDGYWDVEGYGVDPDIEVENTPHEMAAGKDPQLEKAIDVVLDLLKKKPTKKPERPAYPDRSK